MKFLFVLFVLSLLQSCGIYALASGGGCFVKGTTILTPQGDVAIETLTPGREVLAWDETEHKVVVGIVDALLVRESSAPGTLTLSSGISLGVTGDHPVYVAGEWVPVASLKKGDQVTFYNQSTKSIEVQSINTFDVNLPIQTTYNLKVRHYENSFAAGMLAHFY